jgi:hypothetical protein
VVEKEAMREGEHASAEALDDVTVKIEFKDRVLV